MMARPDAATKASLAWQTAATPEMASASPADSFDLYRRMQRIRHIEEAIARRYEEQEMRCPMHLSIGQEAVAVGVCSVLRDDDQITSTHRCHAHYLAKGGDLTAMLAELYGKATGCCGGRGGSMHLHDPAVGMLLSLPIVGSSVPIAAGAALAAKQSGKDAVAVGFTGDGAVEEGVFHETLNFAAVQKLPALFVVENNLFSVYTPIGQRQPSRPLVELGRAHGIHAETADGNDVMAVRKLSAEAVARARRGDGATLLVFDTYRWREHCGPNYDNDLGYRTEAEFAAWAARDPIDALAKSLLASGQVDERALEMMRNEIDAEVEAAFVAAREAPFGDPATVGEHVYV